MKEIDSSQIPCVYRLDREVDKSSYIVDFFYNSESEDSYAWSRSFWNHLLESCLSSKSEYLVYWLAFEDGKKPASWVVFQNYEDFNSCHLLKLFTLNMYRRKSYAKILMKHALEDLHAAMSVSSIDLEVSVSNRAAVEFYEVLGFRHQKILSKFYSNGEDAINMSLSLC